MPIFIPIGGDGAAATEFAGGLMQGVAVHRERRRQEQMAIEAQQRAQEFQVEMEDKRLANSRLREQSNRDFQQLMHRQGVQDQRTLAQEADQRIGARQVADDERAAAAKAQDAAAKAAEAEALMRAAGGGAPGADTEMGPPTTPEGMRPPAPPVTFRDPATARDYLHITDQRAQRAAAAANVAADNARAQAAADEAARHNKVIETNAAAGYAATGARSAADDFRADNQQQIAHFNKLADDAQAEADSWDRVYRDNEPSKDGANRGLRKQAGEEWSKAIQRRDAARARAEEVLSRKGAAATRKYPADVTTEAERREYDALLGRE